MILFLSCILASFVVEVNSLSTKDARKQWEKEFSDHYIQPVLGKLDVRIHNAVDLIANDDKQGICFR